jgi:heptosyltransferase-2/heptosyltransferase-3
MPDNHPLVCRSGAFGDMVLITPLLKQLCQRSGLPCDIVAIGAWNKLLFQHVPWVRQLFTIDSRSRPYWINPGQRKLVQGLQQRRPRFVRVGETSNSPVQILVAPPDDHPEPKPQQVLAEWQATF